MLSDEYNKAVVTDKHRRFIYQVQAEQLWPRSRYRIYQPGTQGQDLLIKRQDSAPVDLYQPFEFYASATNQDREWQQSPHRQFDALDLSDNISADKRNERILSFVNEWGLLGLSGYSSRYSDELVMEFKNEQRLYHSLLVLAKAVQFKKTDSAIQALNEFSGIHWQMLQPSFDDNFYIQLAEIERDSYLQNCLRQWKAGELKQNTKKSFIDWLTGSILETTLRRGLTGVQLSAAFNQPIRTYWSFPSLLAALYLMYWLDLERIKDWQTCEHKPCGNYFISERRLKYCLGGNCAKNAAQARYARGETKPRAKKGR